MARSNSARRTYGVFRSIPVLGPGLRKLVRAAMPMGTRYWVCIQGGPGKGFWIYADPRFELGYTTGDYEPWVQNLLKSELRPGDCYYDVGAHFGFFCLIAARSVGPSGAIVALEPDPQNTSVLRANIERNHLVQVTVLEAAVWSSPGQVTFAKASEASNRSEGHVSSGENSGGVCISVPSVRLDDLVFGEGRRAPDLIKMDVEGAEWEALQGARRLLSDVKPRLLCEVHNPAQMGHIRAYLEQFGYTASDAWKPVQTQHSDYRQLYLWAVPHPQQSTVQAGSHA